MGDSDRISLMFLHQIFSRRGSTTSSSAPSHHKATVITPCMSCWCLARSLPGVSSVAQGYDPQIKDKKPLLHLSPRSRHFQVLILINWRDQPAQCFNPHIPADLSGIYRGQQECLAGESPDDPRKAPPTTCWLERRNSRNKENDARAENARNVASVVVI